MVIVYLAVVMVVGPIWMANKKAFQIQSVLVGYNAGQVLLSSYMFYEVSLLFFYFSFTILINKTPIRYINTVISVKDYFQQNL